MNRTRVATVGANALVLAIASAGWGQEPDAGKADAAKVDAGKAAEQEAKAGWGRFFDRRAREYVITHGGAGAKLVPKPVLNWSVRGMGSTDGAAYVWADAGRPVAIGTVFAVKIGAASWNVLHEFHSLASEPVSARWRGRVSWDSREPGLDFKPLEGSPEPATSAAARLRQMKALAAEFSAESIDARDVHRDLRVLPTPLYRYEVEGPGRADGALFAFVNETDPEALLVLETVEEAGRLRWRYAVASYTDLRLRIRHRKAELWDDPWTDRVTWPNGPHVGSRVERVEGGPEPAEAPGPP